MEQKTILCTGTSGFIGSHLVPALKARGDNVTCLERYVVGREFEGKKTSVIYADLNDHTAIKKIIVKLQPEIVVHLAALSPVAYSYEHWSEVLQTNFSATVNLAEACRSNVKNFRQFVFAGTSEEYGQQQEFPIKENADLRPNSPYAVSKAAADKYLRMLWDAYKFPITVIRPFNTYGRINTGHFVTERIIMQMLQGETLNLGDPEPIRDFLYVDDHVDAYLRVIGNYGMIDRAFNVCTGHGISIRDYVKLIGELVGWNGKVNWGTIPKRPNDIITLIGSNTKAKTLLGWTPKTSLEEGLEKTISQLQDRRT